MFVFRFFGLVAALTVVVNAAPVNDPPDQFHQTTPEEEAAQEAAFLDMSLEQRLEFYSEHKIYKPEGTVKCLRECIGDTPGYPIHTATYGQMCKNSETESALVVWLRDQVGPCIETKRYVGDSNDLSEDNSPCFSAFSFFEDWVANMCAYIQQDFSHIKPDDTWM